MPVPLDEGERIDAARDRRDAIKAWSFILLLLALTLGALRLFWRGYSWLLFSQSTVVFIGALLYIVTRDDLSWSCIATAKLLVSYAQHLNLGLSLDGDRLTLTPGEGP